MKRNILTLFCAAASAMSFAQISDSVTVGAGYANESYYNLEEGEVANVDNSNWDLAFDPSAFGSTIRVNRLDEVYVYPGSIEDFESLDTAGITGWTRMYNSDVYWSAGALNNAADPSDDVDLGWGEYNTTTHITEGSRIFVIKLSSGDYKKLFIDELASGEYDFYYNFLDNSDLQTHTITKADYNEMNFVHFSMQTNVVIEREPTADSWDIVFTNYHSEVAPGAYYGVTGALTNKYVEVLEVSETPTDEATFDAPFSSEINILGYDWKSFNMETYTYDIAEDLTYFIQANSGDVWKLIFTGFNGSSDGWIYFTKEKVSSVSVEEELSATLNVYPNPVVNQFTVELNENVNTVKLMNTNGQIVYQNNSVNTNQLQIDASIYQNGLYILQATTIEGFVINEKVLIAK